MNIDNQTDIIIAICFVLMWLMGYWIHWYKTLVNKHKVAIKLFELAEEHQNKALTEAHNDIQLGYQNSGKSFAYIHCVELIKKII